MTVKEIIKKYLEENGFAGLCNGKYDGCGCSLTALARWCEFSCMECSPAYHVKCRKCGEEVYSTEKEDVDGCINCE